MVYHAVACFEDAIEATKAFLLPVDRGRWLRLAVVVFFLSGGSGVSSVPGNAGQVTIEGGSLPTDAAPGELLNQYLPAIVVIAAVFALVAVGFTLVGSIMEFVLVDSLRRESVTVRASVREHFRKGLSLFAFQIALLGLVAGAVGGAGYLFVLPALDGGGASLVLGIVGVVLVGVGLAFTAGLVHLLTVHFVVPTMLHEDRGLVSGWKRFWPVLRGNIGQFAIYVLLRFGVMIGVGFVAGTVVGIAAVVVGIPFVLVGGLVFFGSGFQLMAVTAVVLAAVAVAYVLVMLAASTVVQVPLKTFTRYYQLLVLGDVTPELDLIPQRRQDVRSLPV